MSCDLLISLWFPFVLTLLQVDNIYPELAELLVVVIKMLLSKSCEFTVDDGMYAYLQPHT